MGAEVATQAKRILIAEDDTTLATALTKLLEQAGFEATSAFNGREALEELERQPFDLLVLDIMMPIMNGFQVMEKLQKHTARPKVIVITADTAQ